jgi:hypothetical protein
VSDDEIDDDAEYDAPPTRKKTKPTHQVTEPKHKMATSFRSRSASGVKGVGDFLEKKVAFDLEKHKASQLISREKLDMERRREERLEREAKLKEEESSRQTRLSMATKVLEMPGASEALKLAAQQVLLKLLMA